MATVKCVVWDLDDTVWDGVLLESDAAVPKDEVIHTLNVLDERGILHAVASRGEYRPALAHLRASGIDDLFSAVEVSWGRKSDAVLRIAETLGIGVDTIAFVDNDPVELAEVAAALPDVRCFRAEQSGTLPNLPDLTPGTVTADARARRRYYRSERERSVAESEFAGTNEEFLASLDLVMTVRPATPADLDRAEELTVRTHQLNTTGRTFGLVELQQMCESERYEVLVASLTDRYGDYGTIGLAVTELRGDDSVLHLLLMSCRVISRGVGAALIGYVADRARRRGGRSFAEFVPTDVNRVMLVALRFAGFAPVPATGDTDAPVHGIVLEYTGSPARPPTHLRIVAGQSQAGASP
ncbi:MAG: HAD-IIIC family phosphatase [Rhodococcus sp.]|nr:HAD-IIIC family phosphatase [Rhodococcus sp. (in: high G+C Gram-positive bacteria)]